MHTDPDWFDDPEQASGPRTGPGRALVVAIAAIPWVLVAAMILLPDRSADPPTTATAPSGAAGTPAVAPPEAADGAPTGTDTVQPSRSDPPVPVPPPDGPTAEDDIRPLQPDIGTDLATRDSLAAVATVAARAWLTGVSPHLDVPGLTPTDPASYAEHVVVEAIDHDDPHLAVVSILAVLLRETAEGLRVDTRRVAVPLAITDGQVQPAGDPWWLPAPGLRTVDLPVEAQTDPAWFEAAVTGLQAAGFQDVEVTSLERTDRWPWRAHISARTSDGHAIDGPVWLRWTGQGFELAGHVPTTTARATPIPRPPTDEPINDGDPPVDDDGDRPVDDDGDWPVDDEQEVDP